VYHVTGIEIANADELKAALEADPFFFWDDDRDDAWLAKDGMSGRMKDAKIKVTYSSGESRELGMAEAVRQNTVWYNTNPNGNYRPFAVQGIEDTVRNVIGKEKAALRFPNYKDPKISFYYRGWRDYIEVPIFTKLSNVSFQFKNEPDISNGYATISVKAQDNDNTGQDAWDLADKIIVTATYTAAKDQTLTASKVLKYQGLKNADWFDGVTPIVTNAKYGTEDAGVDDLKITDTVKLGKPLEGLKGRWWQFEYRSANYTWAIPQYATAGTWVEANGYSPVTYTDATGREYNAYPPAGVSKPRYPNSNDYDGGPLYYSMDFGTPDGKKGKGEGYNGADLNKWVLGPNAWGVSANPKNNDKVKNVTIYYTPGINVSYFDTVDDNGLTGFPPLTSGAKKVGVPVQWSNIPPLY